LRLPTDERIGVEVPVTVLRTDTLRTLQVTPVEKTNCIPAQSTTQTKKERRPGDSGAASAIFCTIT